MEWQPIETAPKDGRYILGCYKSDVFAMRFRPTHGTCYEWQLHDGYPECPTHWMPLPEPPAGA